jgi:hypothetical protein
MSRGRMSRGRMSHLWTEGNPRRVVVGTQHRMQRAESSAETCEVGCPLCIVEHEVVLTL